MSWKVLNQRYLRGRNENSGGESRQSQIFSPPDPDISQLSTIYAEQIFDHKSQEWSWHYRGGRGASPTLNRRLYQTAITASTASTVAHPGAAAVGAGEDSLFSASIHSTAYASWTSSPAIARARVSLSSGTRTVGATPPTIEALLSTSNTPALIERRALREGRHDPWGQHRAEGLHPERPVRPVPRDERARS